LARKRGTQLAHSCGYQKRGYSDSLNKEWLIGRYPSSALLDAKWLMLSTTCQGCGFQV
jgi:hypothetical protein